MLKVIGICLLAAGCGGIGFYESMELTRHEELLKQVRQMMILLKGEIRYGNSSLCDVFEKLSERLGGELGKFLKEMAVQIQRQKRVCFSEIFSMSVKKTGICRKMTAVENVLFLELGNFLGNSDRETQLRQIELYEKELEMCLEELCRQLPQKKKLYQNLGVLGGIFLAILLW